MGSPYPYYFYQCGPETWRPNAVHNERFLCLLTQISAHNGDGFSLIDSCTLSPGALSDNSAAEAITEERPTDVSPRPRGGGGICVALSGAESNNLWAI